RLTYPLAERGHVSGANLEDMGARPPPHAVDEVGARRDEGLTQGAHAASLARQVRWHMNGRQVDPTRNLAQYLRIATVGLDASSPDAQAAHQRCGHDAYFVTMIERQVGNVKGLGACLEDDAAGRLPLEVGSQPRGFDTRLLQDLPVCS